MEDNKTGSKKRGPKSKLGKIAINLLVTAVVGFLYFYISLPSLNLQDSQLYFFVGLLCVVYIACAFVTSGMNLTGTTATTASGNTIEAAGGKLKEYFKFIKSQCLPIGILLGALVVIAIVGQVISMPVFRAGAYRQLLTVETGDFTTDVKELSFNEIPLLDEASARYLSTTQMGSIPDMASQFEVSYFSTQINYAGRPMRVVPLEYADLFKWLTNRSTGLPAYITVDMISQKVEVVRLPEGEGMKYSPAEPLNRNTYRHLRFQYPTFMFAQPSFEIDESGHPWWVCPRVVKTIGLFGGTDVNGAVLMDAVTGESTYYESAEVPQWVDHVYPDDLIMEQYNYYGTLVHGFLNSIFGQKDVKVVTEGNYYIAMNDDVYVYSGITSITSDQSNLGFLLCNQRTKETRFYPAPGVTERSAQTSAQGMVQDLGYTATWPLLLNISGEPTYFMALKDNSQLIKMFAMVNVGQFNLVGTGSTVAAAEQSYLQLLASKGITTPVELPKTQATGAINDITSAVIDGNTYFYVRLTGSDIYYALSAKDNSLAVILKVGDKVTIDHAPAIEDAPAPILDGYGITLK